MVVQVEAGYGAVLRPEGRVGVVPVREQTVAAALTTTSATAVMPPSRTDEADLAVGEEDRRHRTKGDRNPTEEPRSAPAGGYERKLVYERDLKRTFLDVVDREHQEERLMRIPPEKLSRYLRAVESGADVRAGPTAEFDALT